MAVNLSSGRGDLENIAKRLCQAIELDDIENVQTQLSVRIPPGAIVTPVSSQHGLGHMTALHYAAENRHGAKMMQELLSIPLDEIDIDVFGTGEVKGPQDTGKKCLLELEDYTPLAWACLHANLEAAELLISKGANINSQASYESITPLIAVCARASVERRRQVDRIILALLRAGANPQLQDASGNLALHYYLQQSPFNVAKRLILAMSDLTQVNKYGWTLLHCCAFYCKGPGTRNIVEALLSKTSNLVLVKTHTGLTAADLARRYGNADALSILLQRQPSNNRSLQATTTSSSSESYVLQSIEIAAASGDWQATYSGLAQHASQSNLDIGWAKAPLATLSQNRDNANRKHIVEGVVTIGLVFSDVEELGIAGALIRGALALDTDEKRSSSVSFYSGIYFFKMGQYESAQNRFKEALDNYPTVTEAASNAPSKSEIICWLGRTLFTSSQRRHLAAQQFADALDGEDVWPDFPSIPSASILAIWGCALLMLDLKRLRDARRSFATVLRYFRETFPRTVYVSGWYLEDLYLGLGCLCCETGAWATAAEYFQRALSGYCNRGIWDKPATIKAARWLSYALSSVSARRDEAIRIAEWCQAVDQCRAKTLAQRGWSLIDTSLGLIPPRPPALCQKSDLFAPIHDDLGELATLWEVRQWLESVSPKESHRHIVR